MREFLTNQRATTAQRFMGDLWKRHAGRYSHTFSAKGGVWSSEKLERWTNALAHGEVVAAPAEGVYGYCCDPFNEGALRQLLSLKQRSPGKGMIVLIRNRAQLRRFVPDYSPFVEDIADAVAKHWPGFVTLVVPARPTLPDLLTGGRDTVAIRMPGEAYMQEYLAAWKGPLVSTSLNISGQPPVRKVDDIPAGPVALPLPWRLSGQASRIYNVMTGSWER